QHPADVTGREGDREAVRRRVGQALHAVGPEVVILPLLAVGDHRRAGRLELRDRVADRLVVERLERRVGAVRRLEGRDPAQRPGNAADRFGRDRHPWNSPSSPWRARADAFWQAGIGRTRLPISRPRARKGAWDRRGGPSDSGTDSFYQNDRTGREYSTTHHG